MPGTAAEILSDKVRKQICPNKISADIWKKIIKKAHNCGIKTTSTMMYGHVETWRDRINHMFDIKEIQDQTNGFTEFIPLPYIDNKGNKKTSLLEDFEVIALARLILGESLKNIQSSWVKLGQTKAIEALYFGANDLGGTLIEENITNRDIKNSLTEKEMEEMIKKAGKIPQQRTTLYREV